MNNPESTILEFANRLDDLSYINPLYTVRPARAAAKLSTPPERLPSPATLQALIEIIAQGLCRARLPLDPTLPLLQTPDITPLKPTRPNCSAAPLLPHPEIPPSQPFPAYLSAQIEHLSRVSHYNYQVLELSDTKSVTHSAADFCEEVFNLLPSRKAFTKRFGVGQTSSDAIALLSALKTSREAVVPIGSRVFVHARCGGEKLQARNDTAVCGILSKVRHENGTRYRRFRGWAVVAWFVVLLWCLLVIGAGVWPDERGVRRALLDSANVLQLGAVLAILALGVGKEFWQRFGLLLGWRAWTCEGDVVRDVGVRGREALVAGLLSGETADEVVSAFGVGEGAIRLREWVYDPRFGMIVGEKNAFCIKGRRWYKVVKEGAENVRYRLFPTRTKRAFVGVTAGVSVIDGGKEKEVV